MRNKILGDNMRNIVFLDIDGVLNGDRTCIRSTFWFICHRLHITKFYRFLEEKFNWRNVYGIHEEKCKILEKICKQGNADIVLTSSWRGILWDIWNDRYCANKMWDYAIKYPDPYKFIKYCIDHDINIIDSLPYYTNRGTAILDWLHNHPNFKNNYIILDDEWGQLEFFLKMNNSPLIITSDSKPGREILGTFYCRDGLRRCHLNKALSKLNSTHW